MVFQRTYGNKKYKVISRDGAGVELKVPRYKITQTWIGKKTEAILKGYRPRGSENFYMLSDGTVVIDGYLAVPAEENVVEMSLKKPLVLNEVALNDLLKEINDLLKSNG